MAEALMFQKSWTRCLLLLNNSMLVFKYCAIDVNFTL
jgi:hypothetical protein